MPTPIDNLINALEAGNSTFAEASDALSHQTVPVRVSAVCAMAKIAETSDDEKRAAAVNRLKAFALNPENRALHRLGPPLCCLAVEALLRLGDDPARRTAAEVYDALGDVEQPELDAYLMSRGVRF